MRYNIISTGSKGNAVVIGDSILIDCGVHFSALKDVYKDIQLVLLTHIHSDHFVPSTIRRLHKMRPTLRFSCCEWLVQPLLGCGVSKYNIDVLSAGTKYDYGVFKVAPVALYHNVPNAGYRLYFGNEKVFYATDTSTLDGIAAKGYDLYMIEANYEPEKAVKSINAKKMSGKYSHELKAMENHLSKEDCDDFFNRNKGANSKLVYLHQHIYSDGDDTYDNIRNDNGI